MVLITMQQDEVFCIPSFPVEEESRPEQQDNSRELSAVSWISWILQIIGFSSRRRNLMQNDLAWCITAQLSTQKRGNSLDNKS